MKYFKPNSLTWWSSLAPLVGGIVLAVSDELPVLAPVAGAINAMSGGLSRRC